MPDMIELVVAAPDGTIRGIRSGGWLLRAAPDAWHWSSVPDVAVSVKPVAFG